MASSSHSFHYKKNHSFIYTHVKNAKNAHHDTCNDRPILPMFHDVAFTPRTMITSSSSSYAHGRSRSRRRASNVDPHAHRIGMVQMVLLCFITLLMHPMYFIVKMTKLLLPMWDQNARRVRLAFGYQNPM
jgi:hypothetical protein